MIAEFIKGATNVYRTKHFIVRQVLGVQTDDEQNNVVYSHDTYLARTPLRDLEYNIAFKDKKEPNGKRLPSTMYARTYIY